MKSSQLTLLIWVGLLFAVLLSLVIGLRITADRYLFSGGDGKELPQRKNWVNETYPVNEDIGNVVLDGVWEATIELGDTPEIRVFSPGEDYWNYSQEGETLSIGFTDNRENVQNYEVEIVLKDLSAVKIEGKVNLKLTGMDLESLVLHNSGFSSFKAEDSSIQYLDLDNQGAMDVQLKNIPVTSADIRMDGAGNVEVLMNGGTLNVDLNGLGNVSYWGDISSKRFNINGLGNIEHKN